MRTPLLRQIEGHISIVQEERFYLIAEDGRGLLFTLAHNANVGAPQLQRFRAANVPVRVGYTGEAGLASAVAHEVQWLPTPAPIA